MLKLIAFFFKRQSDSNSRKQTVTGPLNEVSVHRPGRAVQLKRLPVSEQETLSKQTEQKHSLLVSLHTESTTVLYLIDLQSYRLAMVQRMQMPIQLHRLPILWSHPDCELYHMRSLLFTVLACLLFNASFAINSLFDDLCAAVLVLKVVKSSYLLELNATGIQ